MKSAGKTGKNSISKKKSGNGMLSAYRERYGRHLSLEQLALLTGTRIQVVKRLVAFELIYPQRQNKFEVEVLPKVRKLLRLHYDLGVSWSSMGLVLELLEKIAALEGKLDREEED